MHLFYLDWGLLAKQDRGLVSKFTGLQMLQGAQHVQAERRQEHRWFNGDYPSWKHASAVNKMRAHKHLTIPF